MSDSRRIPTPFVYRWRRFCYRYVPILIFALCMCTTVVLWHRQAEMGNGLGAVTTRLAHVYPSIIGTVVQHRDIPWQVNDYIEKGDIVCVLDSDAIKARIDTYAKMRDQARAEIAAKIAELELDQVGHYNDVMRDYYRTVANIQTLRLDKSQLRQELSVAKAEFALADGKYQTWERLGAAERLVTPYDIDQVKLERGIYQASIDELNERMKEIDQEIAREEELGKIILSRRTAFPDTLDERIANITEPLVKSVDLAEAYMREVEAELAATVIRAPISGIIVNVAAPEGEVAQTGLEPGQVVQPDLPILSIASTDNSQIVSYIRQDQRIVPAVGMVVQVRSRYSSDRPLDAKITRIGPAATLIPTEQLRDPAIPEWGLPVWIERPAELNVYPGELIDIVYPTTARHPRAEDTLNVAREDTGV